MIVCAGNGENFEFARSIGVGLVNSAINLTKICLDGCVDNIVFVGSAGSYSNDIEIFSLFCSSESTQIESCLISKSGYSPIDNAISFSDEVFENVSYETLKVLPKAIVNSSNYINTDSSFSQSMLEVGILLENMEFFSVMRVAQEFGLPCVGIFCVSNYCNEFAHRDFIKNQKQVNEKISSFINGVKS